MISINEVIETNKMISSQHLDVRTVTMGISLLDCIGSTVEETCRLVYDKITTKAKNLVKVANEISDEIGIPIVNKRISVTPVSLITARTGGSIEVAKTLDKCAEVCGVDFIGGYSALVHKGMTEYEREFINTIPETLSITK
ncbi:MAG: DUF711 family protein, partial [Clostridia bacterium]|nr:DUF711 family protein [Clostridia bacterium]